MTVYSGLIRYFPNVTIVAFIVLYVWCALLYPGGSYADRMSDGFDWVHNYWCHLMDDTALNGQPNPARPWSIAALGILGAGLLVFFFRFSYSMPGSRWLQVLIRVTATLALISATLISTERHDLMTTLASMFGALALCGVIAMLWMGDKRLYAWWGIVCVVLLGLNNYMYYAGHGIIALPLIQKFTFAIVLAWIWVVNAMSGKTPMRRYE